MKTNNQGSGLIITIIVIVLIAVAIALFIPRMWQNQDYRVQKARQDIVIIQGALDQFKANNGYYPPTVPGLAALFPHRRLFPFGREWVDAFYLRRMPHDPWGRVYQYQNPGVYNPGGIDIYSLGPPGEKNGQIIGNWQ